MIAMDERPPRGDEVQVADGGIVHVIAAAWAAIDAIDVDYGPQADAVDGLDLQLQTALLARPGAPCNAVTLIAPRGTGKSRALAMLAKRSRRDAVDGARRVLSVNMDTAGTVESVPSAILAALGELRHDAGKPALRWIRATTRLRDAGVRFVLFDEFNRAARRSTMSGPICEAIFEKIMEPGLAAVAFVGEDDASRALRRAPSVLERIDEELDLGPLDWLRPGDDAIFADFIGRFEAEMLRLDVIDGPIGLGLGETPRLMCEASSGRLRRFVKIMKSATAEAIQRGDRSVTSRDLAQAVQDTVVKRGFLGGNPFEEFGN